MMKKNYQNAFFIIFVLFFACQKQEQNCSEKEKEGMEKEVIEKEVKDRFDQLISAINNSDALAWSEFYSKDGFLSAVVSTDFYASRNTFIDSIKYYFSLREYQHFELLEVEVTALSPEWALMTSREKIEMRLKNTENTTSKHVFTMLWKKEQDGWKIVHSHESWVNC